MCTVPSRCAITLSDWETRNINGYNALETQVESLVATAYASDRFGRVTTSHTNWSQAKDLISLQLYLTITRMRIDNELSNCIFRTQQEYYTLYNIQCLIDKFNCTGYDITPILQAYKLDKTNIAINRGIDYDHITIPCPIQTVN